MPHRKPSVHIAGKRVAVVVNPNSARRKWRRSPKLRTYLQDRFPGRVYDQFAGKAGMIETVARLSAENDVILGLGGDGTLADIMQGIVNSGRQQDVLLGIIPLGSGNAVRKSLRIPRGLRAAVKSFYRGRPRAIDLIDVDGRVASLVSIGATGMVTHAKAKGKIPGLAGHLLASARMAWHPREFFEIELFDGLDDKGADFDHKVLRLKVFDCVVNKTNHFGYNWLVAPKAKIDDGYLDVTIFDIRSYNYLVNFPMIYLGHYQRILKHFKARRVIIRGDMLHAQYNGEILPPCGKLEMKVLPKALRVIRPF
ncbi:MAG: diacylglycerol kinase family protein [Acidobacteriota bacterium]|nr:diacylglycerol kinase family protein [Acidobacteriota bacterium]